MRRKRSKTGGRARLQFRPDQVQKWLNEMGLETTSEETRANEPAPAKPEDGIGPINEDGIGGAVYRLRWTERLAYNAVTAAMTANEKATEAGTQRPFTSASIAAKERLYIQVHKALLKSEDKLGAIMKERGELIALEDVIEEATQIDLAIRTQILTVPKKATGALGTLLGITGKKKLAQIEELLQAEMDDCLRHISKGNPES